MLHGDASAACCASPLLVRDEATHEVVCTACGHVHEEIDLVVSVPPPGCLPRSRPTAGRSNWPAAAERRLHALTHELRLCDDTRLTALRFVQALHPDGDALPPGGARLESLVACCLLLAARISGEGGMLTLRDVAGRADCAEQLVLERWSAILLALETRGLVRADATVRAEPTRLVERFCDTLRGAHTTTGGRGSGLVAPHSHAVGGSSAVSMLLAPSGGARRTARQLLALARDEWLLEGRAPAQVAAAIVIFAVEVHGMLVSGGTARGARSGRKREHVVASALGVGGSTALQQRLSEIRHVACMHTRRLPGRARMTEASLMRAMPHALDEVALMRPQQLVREGHEAQRGGGIAGSGDVHGSSDGRSSETTETSAPWIERSGDGDVHATGAHHEGAGSRPVPAGVAQQPRQVYGQVSAVGPPSFVRGEQARCARAAKIEAASARLQANAAAAHAAQADEPFVVDGSCTIGSGGSSGVTCGHKSMPLDAEDIRIERALQRGVDEAAILAGWCESVAACEDAAALLPGALAHLDSSTELTEADASDAEVARHLRTPVEVARLAARSLPHPATSGPMHPRS